MSKEKNIPIRLDLPESVHAELEKRRGGKKPHAEQILIDWANEQKQKEKGNE